MLGGEGGITGVDDELAARGFGTSAHGSWGATCSGRGLARRRARRRPIRGPWPNDDWKGWWGEEPPY
jgi:hypothetical protein